MHYSYAVIRNAENDILRTNVLVDLAVISYALCGAWD